MDVADLDTMLAVADGLPEATRNLLMTAAAADPEDLPVFLGSLTEEELATWAPAERAGLLRLDGTAGTPLLWSSPDLPAALYERAPFVDRRRGHLALAAAHRAHAAHRTDRQAWHLAAATLGPDEVAAAALERTAEDARAHGGWAASSRLLERAASLTPDPTDAADRLMHAMRAAMYAGDAQRVAWLGDRALALTDDPRLTLEAGLATGWTMSKTTRHEDAVRLLTSVAARAAGGGDLDVAYGALAPAAVAAYYAGDPVLTAEVAAALALVPAPAPLRPGRSPLDRSPGLAHHLWLSVALDPVRHAAWVREVLAAVGHPLELDHVTLNMLGGAAWMADRTTEAVAMLRAFRDQHQRLATSGANPLATGTLGAALRDAGAWAEAEAILEETAVEAEARGADVVRRNALIDLAHLVALRGDTARARDLAGTALAGIDPGTSRSVGAFARQALGVAALSDGDHERAHDVLRFLVDDKGDPAHPHAALFGLVDLVTSSLRTGRYEEAADVADRFRDSLRDGGSARLRTLSEHATALVVAASPGSGNEAEIHFERALSDPDGDARPVERARVLLDLGAWLRRRRRVQEARPHLTAAAETFERLGARPFAERAATELRAAGVTARSDPAPATLDGLSPQQREIVLLAARGLTNKEIGERLYLSPRTVSSHLYRVFPLLGVTSRAQLRDVVPPR
ncbi:LuxR C-terminal-related transcriptional regulator [Antribacter sp. KLBMP9083]|uniref:LuxR C-terminal-related transcriptional regulator n=1 Tax=Antribacter soli TaxID=2910976 RepID=A0AA41Q9Q9_9MICO|nr:helix-turn-helix transcriptional regulator [Antribacter soli]MCF4119463.1 LuxR C-terminal-related transcriptional regulator [Antribacter soli]